MVALDLVTDLMNPVKEESRRTCAYKRGRHEGASGDVHDDFEPWRDK